MACGGFFILKRLPNISNLKTCNIQKRERIIVRIYTIHWVLANEIIQLLIMAESIHGRSHTNRAAYFGERGSEIGFRSQAQFVAGRHNSQKWK